MCMCWFCPQRVPHLQGYLSSNTCRHAQLEDHFTNTRSSTAHSHKPSTVQSSCGGMCDTCLYLASHTHTRKTDLSQAARTILASVVADNGLVTVIQLAQGILEATPEQVCSWSILLCVG